jgi:hypothetical protein
MQLTCNGYRLLGVHACIAIFCCAPCCYSVPHRSLEVVATGFYFPKHKIYWNDSCSLLLLLNVTIESLFENAVLKHCSFEIL